MEDHHIKMYAWVIFRLGTTHNTYFYLSSVLWGDTRSRNLYPKLAPNRMQLHLVQVSITRNAAYKSNCAFLFTCISARFVVQVS